MENKPICEIDTDGTKRWYNEDGLYHRLDGPAIELLNGTKRWYLNGKQHRLDGPAVEHYDGWYEWWANGCPISFDIKDWADDLGIDLYNLTDVDIALIKIVWADYEYD